MNDNVVIMIEKMKRNIIFFIFCLKGDSCFLNILAQNTGYCFYFVKKINHQDCFNKLALFCFIEVYEGKNTTFYERTVKQKLKYFFFKFWFNFYFFYSTCVV